MKSISHIFYINDKQAKINIAFRFYRLVVRTLLFHSKNTGSSPVRNKLYDSASLAQLDRAIAF
jgi:hypothetical protein